MHGLYITCVSGVETGGNRVTRVCTQRETSTKFLKATVWRNSLPGCQLLSIQINRTYLRSAPGHAYLRKYRTTEVEASWNWFAVRLMRKIFWSGLNFANKTFLLQDELNDATFCSNKINYQLMSDNKISLCKTVIIIRIIPIINLLQ